jgi:hypothetical protein
MTGSSSEMPPKTALMERCAMSGTNAPKGTWIKELEGKLFLINFGEENYELIFELPEGTTLAMGQFKIDRSKAPVQIDLKLADGIGKRGGQVQ